MRYVRQEPENPGRFQRWHPPDQKHSHCPFAWEMSLWIFRPYRFVGNWKRRVFWAVLTTSTTARPFYAIATSILSKVRNSLLLLQVDFNYQLKPDWMSLQWFGKYQDSKIVVISIWIPGNYHTNVACALMKSEIPRNSIHYFENIGDTLVYIIE